MHLDHGRVNGQQILPASFLRDIRKNADPSQITEKSFPGPRHGNDVIVAYRSQFWIPFGNQGAYTASGFNGQWCYSHPKHNVVITKFSTYDDQDTPNSWGYERMDVTAFHEIARVLGRRNA